MPDKKQHSGIIAWFAANPVAANLLMVLVVLLGFFEMSSIRKEAFPSSEPSRLSISVSYDSGSAQQSEEGIAIKIEDQLEDVVGIKSITSQSTGSGVSVTVEKISDYDLEPLLVDVKSAVDSISTFPADAKAPVITKAQREEHSLWIQLSGLTDRSTLQKLASDLKSDLLNHADISRVIIKGWLDPMMLIEVSEARLQAYGLNLSDVENAIKNNSLTPKSAVLSHASIYLQLEASKQAYDTVEFAKIPIMTGSDGLNILLGDIADIKEGFSDEHAVLSRFNQQRSIALQIITTGNDDISNGVIGAKDVVEQWQNNGRLPDTIHIETWHDKSTSINERLQLLIKNAATGIVLVFILLAVFLNIKVAFWVAAGLPFTFLGTLYFMGDSYLGLTLNEFTTFGFIMALGIVVDDAVVIGESIYTVRSSEGDTLSSTIKGTMNVAVPTLFGVLTTVAAFYALSNTSGMLGELYSQFAMVVTICLILSVIESKLILPAHLSHLNTQRIQPKRSLAYFWQHIQLKADSIFIWFNKKIYRKAIEWALTFRYAVVVLFLALFIWVIAMPFNGTVKLSFFPDIVGDTITADITMVKDASFGLTHNSLQLIEDKAYQVDQHLSGLSNETYIDYLQVLSEANQSGKVTVQLKKQAPYSTADFTKQWRHAIGIPEATLTINVSNAPRMVDALRIELRAHDDQILSLAGDAFKTELQNIQGVSGIEDNLAPEQPQMTIELTQQGRALGLTSSLLSSQILQSFKGQVVQRYQRNKDEIEVRVRYPEQERSNPVDVSNAQIRTNDGKIVSLSSVAKIQYGFTRDAITRINNKRAVYLSANVDKSVISSTELVSLLKQGISTELSEQYPELDIHFGGEAEQQAETQSSMLQMFLLALIIIYMLLAIPLKSYIQPILIMTAIPFGIVGAILGHWITDMSLGILSLNGIIALSGVVVNDSLLLVARFNHYREEHTHLKEAISQASQSRLRAILLTSLTTFAGLMPLLNETSFQAQFLIPAAVSLGYGILFATVITLILIPVLLLIHQDIHQAIKGLLGNSNEAIAQQ